jgi:hypothetical protein
MSAANLLGRVRGSCSAHYKGQDFWFKDVAAFEIDPKTGKVMSDAFGSLSRRATERLIQFKGTPVGVWTAAQVAVLYPAFLTNPRLGDFATPVRTVTVVDDVLGNLTVPNHQHVTGTGVRFGAPAGTTLPTGIAANTTYYLWCNADGNTVQLYDTEAHALASDGVTELTGQVIPSTAGAGLIQFIQNSPLTITTTDGFQLVIWNAANIDMADLSLGATESMMKTAMFEGYTLHGEQWSDANSLYTLTTGVIGAVPPQQAQIPWAGYEIDWASREPVASASTSTNKLTFTKAHGLLTGQSFTADTISPSGVLPTPLAAATTYYAIVVDAYNIKVATTNGNAIAGTAITLTSVGTAEFDIVPTLLIEGMQSRDLIDVSTKVTWDEVRTSSNGILTRSIKEVETMVGFVPDAVALTVFLNALALQGTGAAVGQAMQMANLDIYGPNETPFIRVYGASLENAPARFGASADRVDKLKFVSNRTFQGNVQNPVIALGVAAPTA